MAISDFKLPSEALNRFKLKTQKADLFQKAKPVEAPAYIREALKLAANYLKMNSSETYLREFYIAPILACLASGRKRLNLFSDEFVFDLEDGLTGMPDYLVTWMRSPVSVDDTDQQPLAAVAEAKKMDFTTGWAQCLAQMVASQRVNKRADTPVWGIVTTGLFWQFGYLQNKVFWRHNAPLVIDPLEKLVSAVSYVLDECEKNGEAFELNEDLSI